MDELGLSANDVIGGYLLVPVTATTEGESAFGFSSRQTLVEIPLSIRGRLFPDSPVRFYGDAGVGIAIGLSSFDGWFIDAAEAGSALMTRTALGVEIGNPEGFMVVLEPVSLSSFFASQKTQAKYGLMAGAGFTF